MDKEIVRNSMVFFESFYSSAEELPDDQFRLAWKAICEYAFYDIEPEDMPLPVKIFFKLVKPNIDSIIKQRAAGQSGGRPKKPRVMESKTPGYENKNPGLSNQKPRVTKSETSPIYDVDVDVDKDVDVDGDVDVVVDVDAPEATTDNTLAHSNRPAPVKIIMAFDKREYELADGELKRFCEYNDELGWKKPLEEAVDRWIANAKPPKAKPKKAKNHFNDFEQHDYDFAKIDDALIQKQAAMPVEEM